MALTKAHNRMIEGAAVNVKDFGAKGDGVTDDTTAIQAAITYAETFNVTTNKGGRRVFIPAGEYVISSTITLAKNKLCQLVGEGQLLTTLSYTGSGVAVEVLGDNTGQNQSFYMADLQIANDGSGTKGFKGNFLAFSGSIERVLVKNFSEENFFIENFENGVMLQTRSEKGTVTSTGLYLKNTNGVLLMGHQCHGVGARTGNSPVNTAFSSYTGSVCIYADNIESLNMQSVVCEGSTTNADCGIWLEEPANRDTPRGGTTINGAYIERCDTGIVLRGFDSNTELRNIAITNGKMGGGSPTNGIIGSNYVYNVLIDCCEISCDAGNHWKFDSTCEDIRIGRLGYQNSAEGGNDSEFPGIHNGINFVNTSTGGEGTVTVFTASNQSSNGSPVDYAPNVISGDYRRIRAVILNINLTVNTTGTSGMAGIKILPKGEGNDSAIFHRIPYGTTDINTAQVIVPVDGTNASITLQQFITSSASWDVDIDVYQVGVLV
ncbi:MAG: hypothetical protein GWP61_28375 [Chloroflexi bacterium]|jgi:hypothetical protein|nr:hypothetical protein [Chloroflexota bacterium]